MNRKTFLDLGIESLSCNTCRSGSCHNIVTSKSDNEEYSVYISVVEKDKMYIVNVCKDSNTSSCEAGNFFGSEEETVQFLDSNFHNFKCF
jgi:hypothetical protein